MVGKSTHIKTASSHTLFARVLVDAKPLVKIGRVMPNAEDTNTMKIAAICRPLSYSSDGSEEQSCDGLPLVPRTVGMRENATVV